MGKSNGRLELWEVRGTETGGGWGLELRTSDPRDPRASPKFKSVLFWDSGFLFAGTNTPVIHRAALDSHGSLGNSGAAALRKDRKEGSKLAHPAGKVDALARCHDVLVSMSGYGGCNELCVWRVPNAPGGVLELLTSYDLSEAEPEVLTSNGHGRLIVGTRGGRAIAFELVPER